MALRARVVAPPIPTPTVWKHHAVKWGELPSHVFCKGDRRMEAETYLSSGYGLRLAIEERATGWRRLDCDGVFRTSVWFERRRVSYDRAP